MAGRRPKPTTLKILAGNPGRRSLPRNEPRPAAGIPACPAWLSAAAKAEWKRIVPELDSMNLLTLADRAALAAYCQAWAELEHATKVLNKEGRVIKCEIVNREGDVTGSVKKLHPANRLQRDGFARVKQFLIEFGLSPASRTKVAGAKQPEEADPLEELLNRGKAKSG